jgi:hypothetical protein
MTDKPEDKTITREKRYIQSKKADSKNRIQKGTEDYGRFTFVDPTPAPTNNIRVLTNLAIRDNWNLCKCGQICPFWNVVPSKNTL